MPYLHASWTRAGTVDISSQFGALTAMGTATQKPESLLSTRSIQLLMRYALMPLDLVRRGFQWSPVKWCNERTEVGSVFPDGELTSMYASFSFGPQALSFNSTGESHGMRAARIVAEVGCARVGHAADLCCYLLSWWSPMAERAK